MRAVTGAHYGVRDWLAQRITALVLLAFSLVLLVRVLAVPVLDFAAWRSVFAPAWMRHATVVFALALCWHAWIGMRDVYMDYVRHTGWRLAAHVVTLLLLLGYALWAAAIVWRLP